MAAQGPVSVRLARDVLVRVDVAARASGESRNALLRRLVDEGLRIERHPGIVFRGGPAGRRAGLAGGPDVWEVVVVLRLEGRGEGAVERAALHLGLMGSQVRTALRYYAEWRDEIDEWIARAEAETAEAEQAARRERDALG